MTHCLKKGITFIDNLYEHIKSDYVLRTVETFVDFLLDDSTKDVIKKYQQNLKSSARQEGTPLAKNFQIKIIGIKLFLIYQKTIKFGGRMKDRFFEGIGMVKASIGGIFDHLRSYVVVEHTCIVINFVWDCSRQALHWMINKLRKLGNNVRYHRYTKRLLVYSNDIKQLTRIAFQVIYQFLSSTIQLKRSRALYHKIISKYKRIKTNCKEIKEQSEILSYKLQSEQGDPDVELLDVVSKKVTRAMRNMKSEDNLYQRRKDSIKESNGEILEEVEDRSENVETSKLEEEEESYDVIMNPAGGERSRISKHIPQPACYMSSNKSSFNDSFGGVINLLDSSPENQGSSKTNKSEEQEV